MKKHIIIIALVVVGLWFWGWTAGRSYPTFKNYYIPLNTATSSMAQLETDVFNLRRDISALKFVLDYEAEGDKHAWSNRLMEFEKRIDLLEHPAGTLGLDTISEPKDVQPFEWFDADQGYSATYVAEYIKRHGIAGSTALVGCTREICWNISPIGCSSHEPKKNCSSGDLEFPVYPYP